MEEYIWETAEEINEKLKLLITACQSDDDETAKIALKKAVPTYKAVGEATAN